MKRLLDWYRSCDFSDLAIYVIGAVGALAFGTIALMMYDDARTKTAQKNVCEQRAGYTWVCRNEPGGMIITQPVGSGIGVGTVVQHELCECRRSTPRSDD